MSSKAQAAKDQGNIAFKAGDYPTAVGHYTTAILADRNDPTFFLNRAAAYLKLGKNEDAERDCTTVLSLDRVNVKALFRRGQARSGSGKGEEARRDFLEASRLQPTLSVVDELKKLDIVDKKQVKKSDLNSTSPAHPLRRRVPITIIEPSSVQPHGEQSTSRTTSTSLPSPEKPQVKSNPGSDFLKPVSSRSLNASSSSSAITTEPASSLSQKNTSPPTPRPTTFKDAKQTRESSKPSRVGGGIFRASGDNTIFPTRDSAMPSSAGSAASTSMPQDRSNLAKIPPKQTSMTLFDFTKIWNSSPSVEERWHLISSIPAGSLSSMFKMSLEPSLLASMLETFLQTLDSHEGDSLASVKAYMDGLTSVSRFDTVVMFLSRQEKEIAREVWRRLGVTKAVGVWNTISVAI